MSIVNSFGYIAKPDARALILGSMPGKVSLTKQQYYGHPQNLFWPFMDELFGTSLVLSYENRLATLTSNGIALWDVIQECDRESSMDSDIVEKSIRVNDFQSFFLNHPNIRHIFFNGTKAEYIFKKFAMSTSKQSKHIQLIKLPSTSPSNASISKPEKLEQWNKIKLALLNYS